MISSGMVELADRPGESDETYTSGRVTKNETSYVQIFPNNQSFNSTKLECLESVGNAKAVFARVLADLIKVLLDQLLLLDELDIGQRFRGQIDSLDNKKPISIH